MGMKILLPFLSATAMMIIIKTLCRIIGINEPLFFTGWISCVAYYMTKEYLDSFLK